MDLGYARVSTTEQDTALQLAALRAANVTAYWEEQQSGIKHRPALEELLSMLRVGDVVVVYKVDRLARSLQDLLRIAERIDKAGAKLRSLTEPIETTTPVGRMIFQLLGAFAEFERNVIHERCEAGREAARQRGVKLGRKRVFDYATAFRMRKTEGKNYREIAQSLKISHSAAIKAIQRIEQGVTSI